MEIDVGIVVWLLIVCSTTCPTCDCDSLSVGVLLGLELLTRLSDEPIDEAKVVMMIFLSPVIVYDFKGTFNVKGKSYFSLRKRCCHFQLPTLRKDFRRQLLSNKTKKKTNKLRKTHPNVWCCACHVSYILN